VTLYLPTEIFERNILPEEPPTAPTTGQVARAS
jgi:hypothetical protein